MQTEHINLLEGLFSDLDKRTLAIFDYSGHTSQLFEALLVESLPVILFGPTDPALHHTPLHEAVLLFRCCLGEIRRGSN